MGGHFEPWLRSAGRGGLAIIAQTARHPGEPPRACLDDFLTSLRRELGYAWADAGPKPPPPPAAPAVQTPPSVTPEPAPAATSPQDELVIAGFAGAIVGGVLGLIGLGVAKLFKGMATSGPLALIPAVASWAGSIGPVWAALIGVPVGVVCHLVNQNKHKWR